jgi:HB1/ASXL restriction endonuclease-like protein with HTH domain
MGEFLDSAYKVLHKQGRPLSAREITAEAVNKKLLSTEGLTPWQTMKAKLSVDILRNGPRSLFMRSEKGKFALREWESKYREHVADRYQKALFDEDIVVFPAKSLGGYIPGTGIYSGDFDHKHLLAKCYPMRRRDAEADPSVIQLVSVFLVRYKDRFLECLISVVGSWFSVLSCWRGAVKSSLRDSLCIPHLYIEHMYYWCILCV